jgi:basic amino acid/polyamine antiporter, APA family
LEEPSTTNSSRTRGHLLRVLGVGFGVAVIIGNTIGAGIFRAPGSIAQQLPHPWLFIGVWILGGVYALLGAVSLSELGAMIPRSGGQYVFARYALGEYAGFIVGWSDWISTCGTTAAVSLLIGKFAGTLVSALSGEDVLVAISVATIFAGLQWRGIDWGASAQNLTSLLKGLVFILLTAAAFALGGGGRATTAPAPLMPAGFPLFGSFVVALQAVIYTYDGWSGVIYFSEEVKDPGRDILRAMFGGVLSVCAIYLLVNLALLYVLGIADMAGQDYAAGAAAEIIFGARGNLIFLALAILSMLSAINACHLMATRVLFAMSRDGLFVRAVANVNRGGTPSLALLLSAAIAALFIAFGQTFDRVITVLAFFFVGNYTLSFISVFVLRRREPEKERPYRAWGYPWTTGLALLGSVLFLAGAVASDTQNSLYALGILAVSYPLFRFLKLSKLVSED